MLTPAQLESRSDSTRTRRVRPVLSPKQHYQEYLLQRIEDYKNSLTRDDLLKLGNDAAHEIHDATEGQYSLTEVVMQETVDRLIMKRLRLPSFTRWKQKHAKVRQAQQSPTHWGLERHCAVAAILPRLETGDHALVVGGGAEAAVYLLAAHDVRLTCLFGDHATCSRIETRMAAESLTGNFEAFVAMLGSWFPLLDRAADLVVVDAGTLAGLPSGRRLALMARLQDCTIPGGVHVVMSAGAAVPEAWVSLYPDWTRIPIQARGVRKGAKRDTAPGVLLSRPIPPASPETSEASSA
jgi:hypothetical protein